MICKITGNSCNCPKCEDCILIPDETDLESDGLGALLVAGSFGALVLLMMGILRFIA
jgi:hypothetical protein